MYVALAVVFFVLSLLAGVFVALGLSGLVAPPQPEGPASRSLGAMVALFGGCAMWAFSRHLPMAANIALVVIVFVAVVALLLMGRGNAREYYPMGMPVTIRSTGQHGVVALGIRGAQDINVQLVGEHGFRKFDVSDIDFDAPAT